MPRFASVIVALEMFLETCQHMAMVIDEFGGIDGLISLEDAIETFLGAEIVDETDPTPDMQELAWRLDGWRGRKGIERLRRLSLPPLLGSPKLNREWGHFLLGKEQR